MRSLSYAIKSGWRALMRFFGFRARQPHSRRLAHFSPRMFYEVLRSYYETPRDIDGAARFRNPARRVVEFYASHLFPGTLPDGLPIETDNAELKQVIEDKIWKWSNWATRKQVYARRLARDGDVFIKSVLKTKMVMLDPAAQEVESDPQRLITAAVRSGEETLAEEQREVAERVYMQLVDAQNVVDFKTDERGHLRMVRIDTYQRAGDGGFPQDHIHTEVWDKAENSVRVWRHLQAENTPLELLGDPQQDAKITDFGIDFVPFVHAKFQDDGNERGTGAFAPFLDKIDEFNRVVQRKHEMFFRYDRPVWSLEGIGNDASGRPLAPPRIDRSALSEEIPDPDEDSRWREGERDGRRGQGPVTELGEDSFLRLPGNAQLKELVPGVDWSAADAAEDRMKKELEDDLPELALIRIRDESARGLSGISVHYQLEDAESKAKEARGNAEDALIRAVQMCLTLGQVAGLEGFDVATIGSYDAPGESSQDNVEEDTAVESDLNSTNGSSDTTFSSDEASIADASGTSASSAKSFEFSFEEREIFPLSAMDKVTADTAKLALVSQLERLGWLTSDEAREQMGLPPGPTNMDALQAPVTAPGALQRSSALMSTIGQRGGAASGAATAKPGGAPGGQTEAQTQQGNGSTN